MPTRVLVVLLLVAAFGCERSSKREHAVEDAMPTPTQEQEEDRSLENDGCAVDFAYKQPYFRGDDGFRPLPIVRDAMPGEIAVESVASGIPSVAVDQNGRVYRYFWRDGGPTRYSLTGQLEEPVLRRVLAERAVAVKAPLSTFAPPHCPDSSGFGEIRLHGLDPPVRSPVILASAGSVRATRRVSKDADKLTRWVLSVHGRALRVHPVCFVNEEGTDCLQ